MQNNGAFTLSDVALILEMDETRVKNWTIGRPIAVKPSVRTGSGPGSRNLYGIEDLYLMALADQLCRDGFTTHIAARVLEVVGPKVESIGKTPLTLQIVGSRRDRVPEIRLVRSEDGGNPPRTGDGGCYSLNLDELAKRVQLSVKELPARLSERKKTKAKKGRQ